MWFPDRIRHVAEVDVQPAIDALNKLDDAAWYSDQALKQKLAGDRPTQSLFFYSMLKEEYTQILRQRPLTQEDVPKMGGYDLLFDDFSYLFEAVQEHYPAGGVFLRAQVALMPPGGKINEHRDNLLILENTHRLHVPIVTTEKLKFFVDKERVSLQAGNIYELNNQLYHWVENPADSIDRIHLIVDYLPPEYNTSDSTDDYFKFYIREHRAARQVKPSDLAIAPPTVVASVATRKDEGDEWHYQLNVIDFAQGVSKKVLDWHSNNLLEVPAGDVGVPNALQVVNNVTYVASGSTLYALDGSFRVKKCFNTEFMKDPRDITTDGRYLYIVSRGTDAIIRFDLKKKKFDLAWRLYQGEQNKIAVKKVFPEKDLTVEASSAYRLTSVFVKKNVFFIAGEALANIAVLENGRIESGDQLPAGVASLTEFNKGVAYMHPGMDCVSYMADYDFRSVKSGALGVDGGHVMRFSQGLARHEKGTLVVGTEPAAIVVLDMKNQSIQSLQRLGESRHSKVLALGLLSSSN